MFNRRARFDYRLVETYEAGLALVGSEVKSVFLGRANLSDAYCRISGTEAFVVNLDIEPYENAGPYQPERRRERKLLLHRKEIDVLERRSKEKGLSIIPTRLYFRNGKAKLEIALAQGKAAYDKRTQIAKDEARRELERARSGKF
ncbi:MAG: SsrA-binding protein SmpB [Fimbriimonas ginsengisoli]|uniref:SsrA-binding protein n=1 Tax=Fimbriimonas ginsengisoli TaxID=1005039 RepID=A0A931LWG2_FIMGI|nr:SsrA-binding protein SmpB [Fimbriimonas ginsengisoli]